MRYLMMSKKNIRVRIRSKNPSLMITVCHHSASLVMPNGDLGNRYFYPTLTLIMDSYKLYFISVYSGGPTKGFGRGVLRQPDQPAKNPGFGGGSGDGFGKMNGFGSSEPKSNGFGGGNKGGFGGGFGNKSEDSSSAPRSGGFGGGGFGSKRPQENGDSGGGGGFGSRGGFGKKQDGESGGGGFGSRGGFGKKNDDGGGGGFGGGGGKFF